MNFTTEAFFTSLVTGSIGYVYYAYGKKQQKMVFLACGIGLMAFPYVVDGLPANLIAGTVLAAIPFVIR